MVPDRTFDQYRSIPAASCRSLTLRFLDQSPGPSCAKAHLRRPRRSHWSKAVDRFAKRHRTIGRVIQRGILGYKLLAYIIKIINRTNCARVKFDTWKSSDILVIFSNKVHNFIYTRVYIKRNRREIQLVIYRGRCLLAWLCSWLTEKKAANLPRVLGNPEDSQSLCAIG